MAKKIRQDPDHPDFGTPESRQHGEHELVDIAPTTGKGTVQVLRRINYIAKLERAEIITQDMASAAEKFSHHFNRAGLSRYSSINLFRVLGGIGESAQEDSYFHRQQVRKALAALGDGLQASLVWSVCGLEQSLAQWSSHKRAAGMNFNEHVVKGMLIAALETLSKHFGCRA